MKFSFIILFFMVTYASGQTKKVELFDLVKKLSLDSADYGSVGDWAVGNAAAYPIKWESDRIEMSDDLTINFFRKGSVSISINGTKPSNWAIMLKGARAGYSSFNISSGNLNDIKSRISIDSLFGKKQYAYKLWQDCSSNPTQGFYFYQLTIPKKVITWLKISWVCKPNSCIVALDAYDTWSKQYADLNCPK